MRLWKTGALILLAAGAVLADKMIVQPGKSCGHGVRTVALPPRSGHRSLDETHYSVDVPRSIPDAPGGPTTSVLTIENAITITDLNVYVDIRHTYVRDLQVKLLAPGDTSGITLVDYFPGDSVVNIIGWFDDEAGTGILQADTPLTGTWRPLDSLAHFDGMNAQGTWTLRVLDQYEQDTGYVAAWGLDINPVPVLQGTVRNASTNVPIAGAGVAVLGTVFESVTGANGTYEIFGLDTGGYSVAASAVLYDPDTVEVHVGASPPYDVSFLLNPLGDFHDYVSDASLVDIPDNRDSATMSLVIPDDISISDLDVTVNILHTYDSDLRIELQAPWGTRVQLADTVGLDGDNFTLTRFDDEALIGIADGEAPFSGLFRPMHPLSVFDGHSSAGTWTLIATDQAELDSGSIESFTVHVAGLAQEIGREPAAAARQFTLDGCYPNPFNARTRFRFTMTRAGSAGLVLFDVTGRRAAEIVNGEFGPGVHEALFDAEGLASGVYFARLEVAGEFQITKVGLIR